MSIKRLDSGRWQVRTRDKHGMPVQRRFDTKREAEQFMRHIDAAKTGQRMITGAYGKDTVAEVAVRWDAACPQWRPGTRKRNRQVLDQHVLPFIGARPIAGISRDDVRALVANWGERVAPRTVARHLAVLRQMMGFAVSEDIIPRSPADGVRLPPAPKPVRNYLYEDQCNALLEAIDPWYRPFLYVLMTTGMRWGEARSLQIQDLDWNPGRVRVRASKTEAGLRPVPLAPEAMALIAEHLSRRGVTAADGAEPLFATPNGRPLDHSNFYKRVYKPAAHAISLPGLMIKDQRSTVAWAGARGGHDVTTVQTLLGHTDPRTTLEHYAWADDGQRRQAVNGLAAGLRAAADQAAESAAAGGDTGA